MSQRFRCVFSVWAIVGLLGGCGSASTPQAATSERQTNPTTTDTRPGPGSSSNQSAALAWQAGVSCTPNHLPLRDLAAAGIVCVEVNMNDFMEMAPAQCDAEIKAFIEEARLARLSIWSVHLPYGDDCDISAIDPQQRARALAKMHQALEICKQLAPRKAVIHASTKLVADEQRPNRLEAARSALKQLTPEFAAIGVQLAVEDLSRTRLGNTSEEILWLCDGIPGLGVCFDTNHLLKETPEAFARKLGAKIVTIHVSDYDNVNERHWFPGEGVIRWPAVIGELRAAGYSGPFMFETTKHKDERPISPREYMDSFQQLVVNQSAAPSPR